MFQNLDFSQRCLAPGILNGQTNILTPPARWAGAAALSLSLCDDSASGCFGFGAMDMSYSYFVQIRYIIFRTPGELVSKTRGCARLLAASILGLCRKLLL